MTHPTLFGHEPITDERLGPRQSIVIEAIREQGYLTDDEAGALVHAHKGKHSDELRCSYCTLDGKAVLVSLRKRKLVVRRHSGEWTLPGRNPSVRPAEGSVPYNEFPPGY